MCPIKAEILCDQKDSKLFFYNNNKKKGKEKGKESKRKPNTKRARRTEKNKKGRKEKSVEPVKRFVCKSVRNTVICCLYCFF